MSSSSAAKSNKRRSSSTPKRRRLSSATTRAPPSLSSHQPLSASQTPDSALMQQILAKLNEIPPILNRNLELITKLDFLDIKRTKPLNSAQRAVAMLVAQTKEDLAMQTYELLDQHTRRLDKYLQSTSKDKPLSQTPLNMEVDPNEPTYCTCGQVAFGEMISCDNPDCDQEWFHVQCVSVLPKKGEQWFCPTCSQMRDRF